MNQLTEETGGIRIGVRYCGGCNPRYDRVALVQRLQAFFPEQEFVPAESGGSYPAVLVVCGCTARCADVSGLISPVMIYLSGDQDLLPARDQLTEALRSQKTQSLDHAQVMEILPHRQPMLFVDTVSRLVPGAEATAQFTADPALPAFKGHFPGDPMLPGIYTVEAAAQAADLMMMTTERYAGKLPLFVGIEKAAFRRKILPGDVLTIYVSLLKEKKEMGMVTCRGQVFTGEELDADMEIRLAFR